MPGLHSFEPDVFISVKGSSGGWKEPVLEKSLFPGALTWETSRRPPRARHGTATRHASSAPKPRFNACLAGLLVGSLLCALALQTYSHWSRNHVHNHAAAEVAQRSFPNDSSQAPAASSGLAAPAVAAAAQAVAAAKAAVAPAASPAAEQAAGSSSSSTDPWPGVSASDADTFACHFFGRLGHLDFSSWELQQPAAVAALAVLRRLHPSERCTASPTTAAPATTAPSAATAFFRLGRRLSSEPSSSLPATPAANDGATAADASAKAAAAAALAPLAEAVAQLRVLSCSAGVAPPPLPQSPAGQPKLNLVSAGGGATSGDPAAAAAAAATPQQLPAGSFVAVRRLAVAVMQQLWEQPGSTGWRHALLEAAPAILGDFHAAQLCGTRQRPVMELLHVSKSGGTSMCQLARMAARKAQHFDQDGNCLQEHFFDEPKWTSIPDFTIGQGITPSGRMRKNCALWPAYDCNQWLATPEVSCAERQEVMRSKGLDFFSNEHALHGSTSDAGSTHSCPQFETLVVMRDPLERVLSHILQITQIYSSFGGTCAPGPAARKSYQLSRNLTYWRSFAPASVNNYFVRSLLGKHFHCMPHGGLSAEHLHQAQAKLMTLDRIVVLEEASLSNVVFRLGMGWPQTLAKTKMRQSMRKRHPSLTSSSAAQPDLDRVNGFAPGSVALLAEWNDLDAQLFEWGKVALKLDSSFLATVAVLNNQTATRAPPPPPSPSPSAPPPSPAAHTVAVPAAAAAPQTAAGRLGAAVIPHRATPATPARFGGLLSTKKGWEDVQTRRSALSVAGGTAAAGQKAGQVGGLPQPQAYMSTTKTAIVLHKAKAKVAMWPWQAPVRVLVDARILLFGTSARLGGGHGAAGGLAEETTSASLPTAGPLEFVCPDVSV